MTQDFVNAIAAVISSYEDTNHGRAMALGTLQGCCEFHLTEKQLERFTQALNLVAERKIGMDMRVEAA